MVNNLITSDQSASRNQHNTQTALHRVVDDWLDNISDGDLTGVCSFDITKCFDAINHAMRERERDKFICNPMGWIQTLTIHTI